MKVLIIQPKHRSNIKMYGKSYMSQLTLPVLASQIPSGNDIQIIDENVQKIDFDADIDLVCITTMTASATRAYEIADNFRKRGVKVLMGGVHVSSLPEEAKKHADSIVIGESEGLFPIIFEDLKNKRLKTTYKLSKKPDLTNCNMPKHELMNDKLYVNIPKVETSRGCPFSCEFCSTTSFFGNNMRYRPIKDVIDEVKKLDTDFIFFTDNNIIGNPRYAKRLFKELIPTDIRWIGQCSINIAKDEELLDLAAASGCVGLLIGFESLSEKTITSMKKKVNRVNEYTKSIDLIHKKGIGIIGCFVFGFDNDGKNVFQKTINFIRKTNIEMPQITILTPFPGSALRTKLLKENRVLHNKWHLYDVINVVFKPQNMSPKELRKYYDKAAEAIYSYPAIILRTIKSYFRHRDFVKAFIFWQVNIVYRRLWLTSKNQTFD